MTADSSVEGDCDRSLMAYRIPLQQLGFRSAIYALT